MQIASPDIPYYAVFRRMCFILLFSGILFPAAQAQTGPGKYTYGELNAEWVKARVYEKDTTAEAVILYDYGKCTIEPYRGTKLVYKRSIKILKKSALRAWGELSITTAISKLVDFSGTIYKFENDTITTQKFDMDQLLQKKGKDETQSKFFFPNVSVGSVIEYTFTLKTGELMKFFPWDFQYPIPVLYSEYEIFFPYGSPLNTAVIYGMHKIRINLRQQGNLRNYRAFDLPAFKEEPLMLNPEWYRSTIVFPSMRHSKGDTEMYWLKHLEENGLVRDTVMMDTKTFAQADFKINANGSLTGSINLRWSGYEARLAREDIEQVGEDEFLESVYDGEQWVVDKQIMENVGNYDLDLMARYELTIPDNVDVTDSLLYINPYLALKEERNPFRSEDRLYPVDLGSRLERTMVAHLTIPEGYEVDEVPESGILRLLNGAALFTVSVTNLGDKIYITTKLKFNKIIFNVPEYAALREFFRQIIERKSRLIVLRKKKTSGH